MAKQAKKIEYEAEGEWDVPVDTVFMLDGKGNPVEVEVANDDDD